MLTGAGLAVLLCGCGGAQPVDPNEPLPAELKSGPPAEPAAAPTKEPVPSGMDCAPAEALCDGGLCKVTVKNSCKQPVTCDLAIVATCKDGQDMLEAKAGTRDTVAAENEGEVGVVARCSTGIVIHTAVKEFHCK